MATVFEAIIKRLKEHKVSEDGQHFWKVYRNENMDFAISIVLDTTEKYKDGWHPVLEGLPEKIGWYLCTCQDFEIWDEPITRELYFYPERKEFVDNIRYGANGGKEFERFVWTKYVTAWQAKPEPYSYIANKNEQRNGNF